MHKGLAEFLKCLGDGGCRQLGGSCLGLRLLLGQQVREVGADRAQKRRAQRPDDFFSDHTRLFAGAYGTIGSGQHFACVVCG